MCFVHTIEQRFGAGDRYEMFLSDCLHVRDGKMFWNTGIHSATENRNETRAMKPVFVRVL